MRGVDGSLYLRARMRLIIFSVSFELICNIIAHARASSGDILILSVSPTIASAIDDDALVSIGAKDAISSRLYSSISRVCIDLLHDAQIGRKLSTLSAPPRANAIT
jgi:hypothetical protein